MFKALYPSQTCFNSNEMVFQIRFGSVAALGKNPVRYLLSRFVLASQNKTERYLNRELNKRKEQLILDAALFLSNVLKT